VFSLRLEEEMLYYLAEVKKLLPLPTYSAKVEEVLDELKRKMSDFAYSSTFLLLSQEESHRGHECTGKVRESERDRVSEKKKGLRRRQVKET
jgi:hypothetical protein